MSLLNFWTSYELGLAVLVILLTIILTADAVVFATIPFKFTSMASSAIVHSFLVCGIHNFGLSLDIANIRGWLFVAAMITLRFTIWSPPLAPPQFMSPVAAHCTGFGLCYLVWKIMFLVYRGFDSLTAFFGIVSPGIPVVTVREITDTSFKIHWWVPSSQNSAEGMQASPTSLLYSTLPHLSPSSPQPSTTTSPKTKLSVASGWGGGDSEIKKHLIEVNGVVIGESKRDEVCVVVTGLNPNARYRVRVWAVSNKRLKSPSRGVLIQTLLAKPEKYSIPVLDESDILETSSVTVAEDEQDNATADSSSTKFEDNRDREMIVDNEIESLTIELEQLTRQQHEINAQMQQVQEQFKKEEEGLRDELEKLRESRKQNDSARAEHRSRLKQLEESKKELDALKSKYEREVKTEKTGVAQREERLRAQHEDIRRLEEETKKAEATIKHAAEFTEKRCMDLEKEALMQRESAKKFLAQKVDLAKQLEGLRNDLIRKRESAGEAIVAHAAEDRCRLVKAEEDALSERIFSKKAQLDHEQRELLILLQALHDEHSSLQAELREESRAKVQILEELNRERRESLLRSEFGLGSSTSNALLGSDSQPVSLPYTQLLLQSQHQQSSISQYHGYLGNNESFGPSFLGDSSSSSSLGLGGLVVGTGNSTNSLFPSITSAPPPGLMLSQDAFERSITTTQAKGFGLSTTLSPGSHAIPTSSALSFSSFSLGRGPSSDIFQAVPDGLQNQALRSSPSQTFLQCISILMDPFRVLEEPLYPDDVARSSECVSGPLAVGTPARAGSRTIESPIDLLGNEYDKLNPNGLIGLGGLFPGGSWTE
ncbi:hypothetical protein BC829DRAFT_416838 [Chytridium lagenaria]|nr:hypothetical protein BC829DRAFT_416838 [Chytridium lagenaria]